MTNARPGCENRRRAARAAATFVEQALLLIAAQEDFDQTVDSLLDALRALETEGSQGLPSLECAEG